MNNVYKKYLFFIVLILGGIIIVETNKIPPIDWTETFTTSSKSPFGLYVLNNELDKRSNAPQKIKRTSKSLYVTLQHLMESHLDSTVNMVIITAQDIDYSAINEASLDFVTQGNDLFLFTQYFNQSSFLDTLGLRLNFSLLGDSNYYYDTDESFVESTVSLTDPKLTQLRFTVKSPFARTFFIPDSLRSKVEVLGYSKLNDTLNPNFIKVPYGKGNFYLHSNPHVFTNLNLLESNNHLYVESVLSYLNTKQTYMITDTYDDDDDTANNYDANSVLRFIFQNEALRWAWYLLLLGVVLFAMFHAKRKQRIIPIVNPLKNTTIEFTQTISNLYKNQEDYKSIINKSIIYTLEKIRREYFIDTTNLDEVFITNYHRKTGKSTDDIRNFVHFVQEIRHNPHYSSANNLIKLNQLIEKITN